MPGPAVVHLDDVPEREHTRGEITFHRRRLGAAAGCARVGLSRFRVPAGHQGMPVHVHGNEEEIVHVLAGEGLCYELPRQDPDDAPIVFPLRPGDTVVHHADGRPHTRIAGATDLELLIFGSGTDTPVTYLPRTGAMWLGPRWLPVDGPNPFVLEASAGPLIVPAPDPAAVRPSNIVALADSPITPFPGAEVRPVGAAAGSVRAGLNHVTLAPSAAGAPAHCHSMEEELFVVLAGTGTLRLSGGSTPGGEQDHALAAGDVVARPPGTAVAHQLLAGPDGLTYLAYGTREPGDAVHYPQLGTVRLRGLGVTLNVAPPPAA